MATPIDPIHVPCHLCHTDPGQGCRWLVGEGATNYFHKRRMTRASQLTEQRETNPETWAERERDVEHSIANGALCTNIHHGICYGCGMVATKHRPPFVRFDKA